VQGAPRGIERVALAAAVPTGGLLHAAAALVQSIAAQAHAVERVHHRDRVGQLLVGGGLETGEPVHRNHLDAVAPGRVSLTKPGLEHLLRSALDHIQQPRWTRAVPDRRQVDGDRTARNTAELDGRNTEDRTLALSGPRQRNAFSIHAPAVRIHRLVAELNPHGSEPGSESDPAFVRS